MRSKTIGAALGTSNQHLRYSQQNSHRLPIKAARYFLRVDFAGRWRAATILHQYGDYNDQESFDLSISEWTKISSFGIK